MLVALERLLLPLGGRQRARQAVLLAGHVRGVDAELLQRLAVLLRRLRRAVELARGRGDLALARLAPLRRLLRRAAGGALGLLELAQGGARGVVAALRAAELAAQLLERA